MSRPCHRTLAVAALVALGLAALITVASATHWWRQVPPDDSELVAESAEAMAGPTMNSAEPCQPVVASSLALVAEDGLTIVLEAVNDVQLADRTCGPPDPPRRVCRSLWLAQVLDPLDLVVAGRNVTAAHAEALQWALDDGAVAAEEPRLAAALRQLSRLNQAVVEARTEDALAAVLVARAEPDIVDPIARAETGC